MRHLDEREVVDWLEGSLASDRARHVDACVACRQMLDAFRRTFSRAAEVEVPEPSPLFWDHFSSNVREAVRSQEPRRPWVERFRRPASVTMAAGMLAVVGLVLSVFTSRRPEIPVARRAPVVDVGSPRNGETDLLSSRVDFDRDDTWAVMRSIAEDVPWDDANAAGLAPQPGAAEQILLELTPAERSELVQLIGELNRNGA